ncbi:MAG: LuxR C-terminal-related transcriptional regulator [Clostridia bacterium]|nr:LuxR C-terminal-related transcriptional regulator [Clostridia bacterium]
MLHPRIARDGLLYLLIAFTALIAAVSAFGLAPDETPVGRLAEYSDLVASQAAFGLRQRLEAYENISFQFVANQDLNSVLLTHVTSEDTYEVASSNRAFSNFLEGFAFGDDGIYDAFFIDESNSVRKALTMRETLPADFIVSFRNSQAFQEILQADGKPVWAPRVRPGSGNPECVLLGRRIKHLFSGRPLGVFVLLIRAREFAADLNDYFTRNFYFSVGTVKASYTLIVDSRGRVVSAPERMDDADAYAAWTLTCISQPRTVLANQRSGGNFAASIGKEQVLVTHQPIEGADWRAFVAVSPRAGLPVEHSPLARYGRTAVAAVGFAVAVGALLVAFPISARRRRTGSPVSLAPSDAAPSDTAAPSEALPSSGAAPEAEVSCEWVQSLSVRERTVLALLAQGYSNREIAARIFVAEQTVKNYVSVIYDKIGVRDRVQVSLLAMKAGIRGDDSANTGKHAK